MLAPVIRMWHRRHPDVAITLREEARIELFLGLVDAGEVDMALVLLPVPDRFTVTAVADEEIVLAAPSDHPLASRPTVRMQDLEGERIVHFAPENGLSGGWTGRCRARGFTPRR